LCSAPKLIGGGKTRGKKPQPAGKSRKHSINTKSRLNGVATARREKTKTAQKNKGPLIAIPGLDAVTVAVEMGKKRVGWELIIQEIVLSTCGFGARGDEKTRSLIVKKGVASNLLRVS